LSTELNKFKKNLKIKLIRIKKNLFYTGGMNKGLKEANENYICLLCDDVVVMPDFIEKMVEFMEKKDDAGMVSPKI